MSRSLPRMVPAPCTAHDFLSATTWCPCTPLDDTLALSTSRSASRGVIVAPSASLGCDGACHHAGSVLLTTTSSSSSLTTASSEDIGGSSGVSLSIRSNCVISKAANSLSRESRPNRSAIESCDTSSSPIDAGRELTGAVLNSWSDALFAAGRVSAARALAASTDSSSVAFSSTIIAVSSLLASSARTSALAVVRSRVSLTFFRSTSSLRASSSLLISLPSITLSAAALSWTPLSIRRLPLARSLRLLVRTPSSSSRSALAFSMRMLRANSGPSSAARNTTQRREEDVPRLGARRGRNAGAFSLLASGIE